MSSRAPRQIFNLIDEPTDDEFDNDNIIGEVTNDAQDRVGNQASDGADNSKSLIVESIVDVKDYDNFIDNEAPVDETIHMMNTRMMKLQMTIFIFRISCVRSKAGLRVGSGKWCIPRCRAEAERGSYLVCGKKEKTECLLCTEAAKDESKHVFPHQLVVLVEFYIFDVAKGFTGNIITLSSSTWSGILDITKRYNIWRSMTLSSRTRTRVLNVTKRYTRGKVMLLNLVQNS
nr:hypothetical protein [Tanacetum cinerariifolium]